MHGTWRRRAFGLPAATLAVIALVGGCASAETPSGAADPDTAATSSSTAPTGPAGPRVLAVDPSATDDPHHRDALRWVEAAIGRAPMIPGAVLDVAAPDSDDLDWTPPTANDAQVYEFFRVPESFTRTTAAVRRLRMPTGFDRLVTTINQISDPTAEATSYLAGFDATIMREPYVEYDWASDPSGTLIRLKAQVSWIPTRPAGTLLDADDVTAITVTTVRQGVPVEDGQAGPAPTTRTITDRTHITGIVNRFNGYPIQPSFRHTCVPAPRFDTVTFRLAGHTVVATFQVGTIDGIAHPNTMAFDCDSIAVSGAAGDFGLIGGDDFHRVLTTGR